jgi:hypothetical protein
MTAKRLGKIKREILEWLRKNSDSWMPWEPQLFSGEHPSSYSSALHELAKLGYVDISYASSRKKLPLIRRAKSVKLTKDGFTYLRLVFKTRLRRDLWRKEHKSYILRQRRGRRED